MKYTAVSDLRWANPEHTAIECVVVFDGVGALPFTATALDVEVHGRDIFARAVAGDFGMIAPATARFATVPEALTGRQADCDALAVKKRAIITGGISPAEMASWPIKRTEALAYQASGNAADAPMLQVEATARGVTLADLAAKVLAKAALLSQFEATIAGNNGKHNDALDALAAAEGATVAQLEAYDITTGWPV